jgi:hypothetical protein
MLGLYVCVCVCVCVCGECYIEEVGMEIGTYDDADHAH